MTMEVGVPAPEQAPPQEGGHLLIQDSSGLRELPWQRTQASTVQEAQDTFTALLGCGYRAYRLGAGSRVHEEVKSFDPQAQEIVLLVPLRGGSA